MPRPGPAEGLALELARLSLTGHKKEVVGCPSDGHEGAWPEGAKGATDATDAARTLRDGQALAAERIDHLAADAHPPEATPPRAQQAQKRFVWSPVRVLALQQAQELLEQTEAGRQGLTRKAAGAKLTALLREEACMAGVSEAAVLGRLDRARRAAQTRRTEGANGGSDEADAAANQVQRLAAALSEAVLVEGEGGGHRQPHAVTTAEEPQPPDTAPAIPVAAAAATSEAAYAQWRSDFMPAPIGRSMVIDFETTGLPGRNASYKELHTYDSARIVSVAWRVLGPAPALETVAEGYHVVRPDGYTIPGFATRIHGISTEAALAGGVPVQEALSAVMKDLQGCSTLVAHNARFDLGILSSELFRLGRHADVELVQGRAVLCTMIKGASLLGLRSVRLAKLLMSLTGRELENAHDARADVDACAACFAALLRGPP
ncbi:hypothetical protein TSOC_011373 [Tetrabaena socialis]|uniref:Exonuclease domain-containing protein n=1 Tax=Tetrabaena socialis TaxID=47790 RepID=A0A2J7ZQS6_9CHLO|nr:hypothetical protein TSOC_011373 [Tetrabaena socialis]|eukprot:PNH02619.1 hypothetical protein TSOC_011373 [Tetrabaena socialis]